MDGDAAGKQRIDWTAEDIFNDFKARREGFLRALTLDVVEIYKLCDPGKGNLRLYGLPNGRWEVSDTPNEASVWNIPKPPCFNYFVTNVMLDWLIFVAGGSELWLYSVAFAFASRSGLAIADMVQLHRMIRTLPDLVEVVSGFYQKKLEKTTAQSKEDPKVEAGSLKTKEEQCSCKRAHP